MALEFVDPRLLNPQLGALSPLLGATTTGGLYATLHRSHQLPWSAHAQFLFLAESAGWKAFESIRWKSRNIALHWQPTAGQWAANRHSIQQWWGTACRTGPALQTVPCQCWFESWCKETETVKVHAIFQLFEKIAYVTLTYNIALLSSLLTIFARVRKEQYHRLSSCYTAATSRAPVFQQCRLNSWNLAFWSHSWAHYPSS